MKEMTQVSKYKDKSLRVSLNCTHTDTHTHTQSKKVIHSSAKVREQLMGTHCMDTLIMYTHIRAVANVCLSVCLALRRTVLNSVKQLMKPCCAVCGRMCSVSVTIGVMKVNTHRC